jgi:hypothetical protein
MTIDILKRILPIACQNKFNMGDTFINPFNKILRINNYKYRALFNDHEIIYTFNMDYNFGNSLCSKVIRDDDIKIFYRLSHFYNSEVIINDNDRFKIYIPYIRVVYDFVTRNNPDCIVLCCDNSDIKTCIGQSLPKKYGIIECSNVMNEYYIVDKFIMRKYEQSFKIWLEKTNNFDLAKYNAMYSTLPKKNSSGAYIRNNVKFYIEKIIKNLKYNSGVVIYEENN